jgi:hypothetical protein
MPRVLSLRERRLHPGPEQPPDRARHRRLQRQTAEYAALGQRDACPLNASGERLWVTERQEDRLGLLAYRPIEQGWLLPQRPGDEPASNRLPVGNPKLVGKPIRVPIAATDESKTTGGWNGRRETPAGGKGHGRRDDRMPCSEAFS